MTQQKVDETECEIKMNKLEKVIKKYFWYALITILGMLGGSFKFYHSIQTGRINSHASASINSDKTIKLQVKYNKEEFKEQLKAQESRIEKSIKAQDARSEKRFTFHEKRILQVEKSQATMTAQLSTHMKHILDTCNRIETKQTRIEQRFENNP